jgi:hypothetical protein
MRKIMLITALGLAFGWFGFMQFQQVQTDRAAASVSRNIAKTSITLPSLSTAAPVIDTMSLAAAEAEHKHVAH